MFSKETFALVTLGVIALSLNFYTIGAVQRHIGKKFSVIWTEFIVYLNVEEERVDRNYVSDLKYALCFYLAYYSLCGVVWISLSALSFVSLAVPVGNPVWGYISVASIAILTCTQVWGRLRGIEAQTGCADTVLNKILGIIPTLYVWYVVFVRLGIFT